MPACRTCGEEINFIMTVAGKWMPVNVMPVRAIVDKSGDETYMLAGGKVVRGRKATEEEITQYKGQMVYVPHWKTCNTPEQHRRKKCKG